MFTDIDISSNAGYKVRTRTLKRS